MAKEKIVSPVMSLKGWNFFTWLKGNWKTIKEVIKVGVPLVIGNLVAPENTALIAIITAFGKLILDTGEYFFKEYKE